MGKVKSAICLTLITLIIAVLCLVCFVPFPVGSDGIRFFNPVINWADKSADLGGYQFGGEAPDYIGGGYSIVYYPDGVISAEAYKDNAESGDETEYVPYADGALYLDKETVCGGGTEPTEEFLNGFNTQLAALRERFSRLRSSYTTLEVSNGLTVRVTLPAATSASVAAFLYFSYTGELKLLYGTSSDVSSATQVLPETGRKAKPIGEYIEGARMRNNAGTVFVQIDFTDAGLDLVSQATQEASSGTGYLFVQVGENTVINLTVSEQVHDDLYISGSYTQDTATIVAATIDTALEYGSEDFTFEMGELYRINGKYAPLELGNVSLTALDVAYIAFGVCFLAMMVFFFIRYGRLGFAHLYTYLIFLLAMVLFFWIVPIPIGAETIAALLIASVLLSVSNAVAYEYARKEYAVGKTIVSSVKNGYKKCFWHIFDLHIALLVVALLVYLIALTELSMFGLALLFGVALSALCTLAVNRFLWYIMMPFAKDAGKFCHYKREEVEDDD